MLTSRYDAIPQLGELKSFTGTQSMVAEFKADYMAPFLLIPGMEKEKREAMFNRIQALRLEASNRGQQQGGAQKVGNFLSGLAGSILNPLSLATGEVAGGALKVALPAAGKLVGKYLPSVASAFLTKPVSQMVANTAVNFATKESVASLTGKAVSGFTQATAFSLPEAIANTYNPATNMFNWHGGIKQATADGGFGLTLMAAPYLGGILWGKLFRGGVDHVHMPLPGDEHTIPEEAPTDIKHTSSMVDHIDNAITNKNISSHEGKWLKDYFTNADTNENLSSRASEMLIKDGHPIDAANKQVLFKILHPDDIDNFQTAVQDKLAASHLPKNMKDLINQYIAHNRMDGLRGFPASTTDGLNGVISFVRKRLEKAPEETIEFSKVVRRLLPENLKEENPFTQHKIYKMVKAKERTALHIPEHVEDRIRKEEKIRLLKQKIKDYTKEFSKTGRTKYQTSIERTQGQIEQLQSKIQGLLGHDQEINHLRNKLMPDGKVIENFKSTKAYGRLMDLTRVRNDARHLMYEINLKAEYELQEAYATVLDTITKVMRSEFGQLAKAENVNNYMSERLRNMVPEFKDLEIKAVKEEIKTAKDEIKKSSEDIKHPEKRDEAVERFDQEIKESKLNETKLEYDQVKKEYQEFKSNETVFSNLVKCVIGARNG
jgi:hypothetical protein